MSSAYADEGTVAHALAAMCLEEDKPASAYVGRLIRCEDYEHAQLSPSGAHRWMRCPGSHALETRIAFKPRVFSMQVTEEMAEGVQIYLDNLESYVQGLGHQIFERMVEQELPVDHLTAEEGATGSGDFILLDFNNAEIQVHDLKFGKGVEVLAADNEQLMMYLSGALEAFGEFAPQGGWQRFRGVIHQPRISSAPSEHVWTREELEAFAEEARAAAVQARNCVAAPSEDFDIYLEPGDKQCRFCDAKATCPAIARKVQNDVGAEFSNLDEVPAVPSELDELAKKYAAIELIESWCKAVAAQFEGRLLAGDKHPDWKLVQGRRGVRAWASAEEAETALRSMRLKHDQMYEYHVISPTAAEKLVKSEVIGKRQWTKLQPLVKQADGKPAVVPVSDKRPAIEVKPVLEEFQSLPEEELV